MQNPTPQQQQQQQFVAIQGQQQQLPQPSQQPQMQQPQPVQYVAAGGWSNGSLPKAADGPQGQQQPQVVSMQSIQQQMQQQQPPGQQQQMLVAGGQQQQQMQPQMQHQQPQPGQPGQPQMHQLMAGAQQQQQQGMVGVPQPPQQQMQQPQQPGQAPLSDSPVVGEDPRNLIVNYIPTPVTDHELRQLFEQYGELESARVICDRVTAHPKGYGFVKYKDETGARTAMENMNGFEIYNKRLKVTMAKGPHNAAINNHTQRLQTVVAQAQQGQVLAQGQVPPQMLQQLQPQPQQMMLPGGIQPMQQATQGGPVGQQPQQQGAPVSVGGQQQGGNQQPQQTVQYVIVDNNMQPIQTSQLPPGATGTGSAAISGKQMGGAVMLPGGTTAFQPQQQQQQQPSVQPLQMFRVPVPVSINQANDPMNRDSCQFNIGSQYGSTYSSFTSTPGISSHSGNMLPVPPQQQQQLQQVPQQQGVTTQQQMQQPIVQNSPATVAPPMGTQQQQ